MNWWDKISILYLLIEVDTELNWLTDPVPTMSIKRIQGQGLIVGQSLIFCLPTASAK